MKKALQLTILFMLLSPIASWAQTIPVSIPGTRVSFSFPKDSWAFIKTTNPDKNTTIYNYGYIKDYVIDSVGDTIIPTARVYVKKNYTGTVFDFAYDTYISEPFQSLNEFSNELSFCESIGYLGAYKNIIDGKDYELRMIFFKDKNTAIEIRLEATVDNYADFEEQFQSIIESITIKK